MASSSTILIVSPSITRDKEFREKLAGNITSDREVMTVVREAFNKDSKIFTVRSEAKIAVDEARYAGGGPCSSGNREELEIRTKLFLEDFDAGSAIDAVDAALDHLSKNTVRIFKIYKSSSQNIVIVMNCCRTD
jgi:hypothetical protein